MDAETLAVLDSIANRAVDVNYVPMIRQRIRTIRVNTHGWEFDPVTVAIPQEKESEAPAQQDNQ